MGLQHLQKNVEPPVPQSVPSDDSYMCDSTSFNLKKKKALVSMFTKHNEPVCVLGYIVTGLKSQNMVIAETVLAVTA